MNRRAYRKYSHLRVVRHDERPASEEKRDSSVGLVASAIVLASAVGVFFVAVLKLLFFLCRGGT